jgi:drug/metabolite transporter (DMT)-like permease
VLLAITMFFWGTAADRLVTFEGIAERTRMAGPGNAAVLINTAPFFTVLFTLQRSPSALPRRRLAGCS